MRLFYFFIFLSLFFSSQAIFAVAAEITTTTPTDCSIITTLKQGSQGIEVQCLQEKVGVVTDGSFGPITKIAIVTFQIAHGLIADGIVGPLTRTALESVAGSNLPSFLPGCVSTTGFSTTTGVKCDSSSVNNNTKESESSVEVINDAENINPNFENLDLFIEAVVKVSKKNGYSEKELQRIIDSIKKTATSNKNFRKDFDELLIKKNKELSVVFNNPSVFDKVVTQAYFFLGITPRVAEAITGVPFGGVIFYTHPCEDGGWTIGVSPLPPSFPAVLTYYSGSQAFLGYNLPFARFLLGNYTPGGFCTILPAGYPTEGTITSMVGSSSI